MRLKETANSPKPDPVICPSCTRPCEWEEYERHGKKIWAYPRVKRLTPPVGPEEENPLACPECEEETRKKAQESMIHRRLASAGVPERFRGYTLDRILHQQNHEELDDFKDRVWNQPGYYGVAYADLEAYRICEEWVKYMNCL